MHEAHGGNATSLMKSEADSIVHSLLSNKQDKVDAGLEWLNFEGGIWE